MKYICMEGKDGKLEIFLFPRSIDHDAMAEVLDGIKNHTQGNWERVFRYPVSAGFVDHTGTCHGLSETLGLEANGSRDTELLTQQGLF